MLGSFEGKRVDGSFPAILGKDDEDHPTHRCVYDVSGQSWSFFFFLAGVIVSKTRAHVVVDLIPGLSSFGGLLFVGEDGWCGHDW